jgi:hypothetical protein
MLWWDAMSLNVGFFNIIEDGSAYFAVTDLLTVCCEMSNAGVVIYNVFV